MTQAASTYAQALYFLAKDESLEKQILEEMSVLLQAFEQEPDFVRILCAPNLPKQERCGILDDSFRGRIHPYSLNFMKVLTEKGHIRHFVDCCKAYRSFYNDDHGILSVEAVSAVELTAAQQEKLTKKLSAITGKTVSLSNRVDPTLLGGLRLDYDGKRVDGTVRNRLDNVRQMLINTVL